MGHARELLRGPDAARPRDRDWLQPPVWAYPGQTFFVRILGNNSGQKHFTVDIPAEAIQEAHAYAFVSRSATESSVGGQLWGVNATKVWDGVIIHHAEGVQIEFVPGSGSLNNNAHPDGIPLPDALFESDGTLVGYEDLDGVVPPGYQCDSVIIFEIRAVDVSQE